jgi:hypothetical protein
MIRLKRQVIAGDEQLAGQPLGINRLPGIQYPIIHEARLPLPNAQ